MQTAIANGAGLESRRLGTRWVAPDVMHFDRGVRHTFRARGRSVAQFFGKGGNMTARESIVYLWLPDAAGRCATGPAVWVGPTDLAPIIARRLKRLVRLPARAVLFIVDDDGVPPYDFRMAQKHVHAVLHNPPPPELPASPYESKVITTEQFNNWLAFMVTRKAEQDHKGLQQLSPVGVYMQDVEFCTSFAYASRVQADGTREQALYELATASDDGTREQILKRAIADAQGDDELVAMITETNRQFEALAERVKGEDGPDIATMKASLDSSIEALRPHMNRRGELCIVEDKRKRAAAGAGFDALQESAHKVAALLAQKLGSGPIDHFESDDITTVKLTESNPPSRNPVEILNRPVSAAALAKALGIAPNTLRPLAIKAGIELPEGQGTDPNYTWSHAETIARHIIATKKMKRMLDGANWVLSELAAGRVPGQFAK